MNSARFVAIIAVLGASASIAAAQHKHPTSARGFEVARPMALNQLVIGDSARYYALKYERYEDRRQTLAVTGAFTFALGIVAWIPRKCERPRCLFKTSSQVNKPLVITGATLALSSLPFKFLASKAQARALWWHNTALAQILGSFMH